MYLASENKKHFSKTLKQSHRPQTVNASTYIMCKLIYTQLHFNYNKLARFKMSSTFCKQHYILSSQDHYTCMFAISPCSRTRASCARVSCCWYQRRSCCRESTSACEVFSLLCRAFLSLWTR